MLKQLVVAVSLLTIAVPVLAQTPGAPPAQGPQGDSAAPVQATPELRAAREAMRQACAADIASLCKDVQPGRGKLRECLHYNRDHLSPGCLAAWQKIRAVHGYTRG
ncbi:MAG TPA: cysteine rich repeat-containing protein [Rhizomicrobium sp.]|nr:cysteine rich repeat-containing protein [Rhizomicrobium sp.]